MGHCDRGITCNLFRNVILTKKLCDLFRRKPFMCEDCGRSYPQRSSLNRHMKIHRSAPQFTCDRCFYERYKLQEHQHVHNPTICPSCSKSFVSSLGYQLHSARCLTNTCALPTENYISSVTKWISTKLLKCRKCQVSFFNPPPVGEG